MTVLQALVLGVVQGATEFLPVSSSGHLVLIPRLVGWEDQGLTFDAVVHVGTLVAILCALWREWVRLLRSRSPLLGPIALATLPAVVAGALVELLTEGGLRSPTLVASMLIVGALALFVVERYGRRDRGLELLGVRGVFAIGVAQALSLVPGTSRQGATMVGGMALGLTREAATRLSFLLATPIVALAGGVKLIQLVQEGGGSVGAAPLAVGFISALVVGVGTIHVFLAFVRSHPLYVFAVYRIVLGITVLRIVERAV